MHDVVSVLSCEVAYSVLHAEIPGVQRIATPVCFPYPVERGLAQSILFDTTGYCVYSPTSFVEVPCNGKEECTNSRGYGCSKEETRLRDCLVRVRIRMHHFERSDRVYAFSGQPLSGACHSVVLLLFFKCFRVCQMSPKHSRNVGQLSRDMISTGVKSRITCVDKSKLGCSLLGATGTMTCSMRFRPALRMTPVNCLLRMTDQCRGWC